MALASVVTCPKVKPGIIRHQQAPKCFFCVGLSPLTAAIRFGRGYQPQNINNIHPQNANASEKTKKFEKILIFLVFSLNLASIEAKTSVQPASRRPDDLDRSGVPTIWTDPASRRSGGPAARQAGPVVIDASAHSTIFLLVKPFFQKFSIIIFRAFRNNSGMTGPTIDDRRRPIIDDRKDVGPSKARRRLDRNRNRHPVP